MKISKSFHLDSISELSSEFVADFKSGTAVICLNKCDDRDAYYLSVTVRINLDDVAIFTPDVKYFSEMMQQAYEITSYLELNDITIENIKYYK